MYTYEDIQKQKAGLLKCQKDHIETCCDCDDNFRCTLQMQHIEFEEAQQQEIARIKRQLNCERQTVSMLKSFGLHYGEFPRLEADKLIDKLVADKDEQAGRIMQYDTALKLACNDIAEKDAVNPADFEAINKDADYNYGYFMARADALLGGKEDV